MNSRSSCRMLAVIAASAFASLAIGFAGVSHAATADDRFTVAVIDIPSDVTCVVVGIDDHKSGRRDRPVFLEPGQSMVVTELTVGSGDTVHARGGKGMLCSDPVTEPISMDVSDRYWQFGHTIFVVPLLHGDNVPH